MPLLQRVTGLLALIALMLCLGAAGCGEGAGGGQGRPASEVEPEPEPGVEGRAEGGDGGDGADGADGADGGNGEDGEDGEDGSSGSQSNSIVQSSGSGSVSSSSSSSSGPGVKTFSGNGATTLSFDVEKPARLVWTNSEGRSFSARGDGISIDSSAGRGEVPLDPGSYDGVKVRGTSWTIVVRPR
jgi:hypothetical protein